MKNKIILILLIFITSINGVTIISLMSWSNVPEPAKSILGYTGLFGILLYVPVIYLIASDEAV